MNKKFISVKAFLLFSIIFLVGFASSLSCNFPTSSINVNTGDTPSAIAITCSNSQNSSVQLWNNGNFFQTDPSFSSSIPFNIPSNSSNSFTVIFNPMNIAGTFSSSFWSSDGMMKNINVNVTQSNSNGCQLNPSMSSLTQTVQEGTVTPLNKITFSPINCDGNIVYDSSHLYMEGGIISEGLRKPILISSIVNDGVNIEINTQGLNSQTYTSYLDVNEFGRTWQIPFVIIVTSGTSQGGNISSDNLPQCSINAVNLNLNQSYSLTCSNMQPDISVFPTIDNNYIQGTGVDLSQNYVWHFKAKKIGYTNISACFNYLGSPLGSCFNQPVQITASGSSSLGGTILDFVFFQDQNQIKVDDLKAMETILNIVDNQTRNIVSEPKIYLNGLLVSNNISFEFGKTYELRATAFGYEDKVISFNVSAAKLMISLEPNKNSYQVGDSINITSNIDNCTFLINDKQINSPYNFLSPGTFNLIVQKTGYVSSEMNITVDPQISYNSLYPQDMTKWKKGDNVIMKLTDDSIWNVYYREEYKDGSGNIAYKDPKIISTGIGSEVSFNIDGKGYYDIKAKKDSNSEETLVLSQLITSKSIDWGIFEKYWYYFVGGIVLLIILIKVFTSKGKESPNKDKIPFGGSFGGGSGDLETTPDYS